MTKNGMKCVPFGMRVVHISDDAKAAYSNLTTRPSLERVHAVVPFVVIYMEYSCTAFVGT